MIYCAIIFLIIIIIVNLIKEKQITNPIILFSGVWALSLLMTSMKLYNMIDYSTKSLIIITCGIFSFLRRCINKYNNMQEK